MAGNKEQYVWVLLRIWMAWIFLWSFFDKLLGLGFSTSADKAWLAGGSPTSGFLQFATHGPFASFYQGLAEKPLVDWLYMAGLLFVGTTLMLGILIKLGGSVGILMLFLFYTAGFLPPENNIFLDQHVVYITVIIGLIIVRAGQWFGLGKRWTSTALVKKYRFLE